MSSHICVGIRGLQAAGTVQQNLDRGWVQGQTTFLID